MGLTRRSMLARTGAGGMGLGLSAALGCGQLPGGDHGGPVVEFGDPVDLLFWHTQLGPNRVILDEMAARFNTTNGKNIKVKGEYQGTYQQLFQRTMAAIQAGTPPDAAAAFDSMAMEYGRANALVDLSEYLTRGPAPLSKESLADIFPQYIEGNRYAAHGRRLLSFPFAVSLAVLYYNEDLLRRAGHTKFSGQTLEEFRQQVSTVSRRDVTGRPLVQGHYIKVDASYIDAFISANGGEMLSADQRRVRFHEPPGVEIFELWSTLTREGRAYTSEAFNYQGDFALGRVASVHDTSASRPFLRPDRNQFRWGVGLIPQKDATRPVTVTFGGALTLFKSSPLEQAAGWEWIKFLTDREQTVTWAIKSSYLPVRKSAADHPDLKAHWQQDPQGEQAFRLTPFARPEPNVPVWPEIRELLQQALASVLQMRAAPRAALEEAAKQANKLIEDRR